MAEDRGPVLAGVVGAFLALSWIFVSLRLYVKAFLTKGWGADDILLAAALIFFSTYCASSLEGIKYGTGRHVPDIPQPDVSVALYYWWLCELFYTITTVLIRLSIAVLLLRICVSRVHRIIIQLTLAMVLVFSTFYFFLVMFQCNPVSYFWNQYAGQRGSCINPAAVPDASIAHSAVSFTADWILGLLPVAMLWKLHINRRTKISVAVVLGLGLLAGIATMIRVPYIKVLALTDDFLFATTDVAIWSTIEPGLGLIATGAVTLRPLFRSFYSLTTRSGDARPPSSLHTSPWRNSRAGYIRETHSRSSEAASEWEFLPQKTRFSSTSKVGTVELGEAVPMPQPSRRRDRDGQLKEEGSLEMGGIKVHRTVIISREEWEDGVAKETV